MLGCQGEWLCSDRLRAVLLGVSGLCFIRARAQLVEGVNRERNVINRHIWGISLFLFQLYCMLVTLHVGCGCICLKTPYFSLSTRRHWQLPDRFSQLNGTDCQLNSRDFQSRVSNNPLVVRIDIVFYCYLEVPPCVTEPFALFNPN